MQELAVIEIRESMFIKNLTHKLQAMPRAWKLPALKEFIMNHGILAGNWIHQRAKKVLIAPVIKVLAITEKSFHQRGNANIFLLIFAPHMPPSIGKS